MTEPKPTREERLIEEQGLERLYPYLFEMARRQEEEKQARALVAQWQEKEQAAGRMQEVLGWLSRKLLWLSDNQHKLRRIQIQAMAKQLGKVAKIECGSAGNVAKSTPHNTLGAINAEDGDETPNERLLRERRCSDCGHIVGHHPDCDKYNGP